ncbi:MAG: HAD family hydrolase [Alphaproteobacteria bacterium]|nr:HAD family hydrolase [Alphaproteobacteria bacterium]
MRPDLRAVLFDKDGTLLDYRATWLPINRRCAAEAAGGDAALAARLLAVAGHDPETDDIDEHAVLAIGTAGDVARAWLPWLPDTTHDALTRLVDGVFTAAAATSAVPVGDLAALLDDLRGSGRVLGIATHDNEAATLATLEHLGLRDRFAFVAAWDSGHGNKPGRGMVDAFCAATGVVTGEVVVVGDSVHDLQMARNAAAGAAVGVLTGAAREPTLRPFADVVLPDVHGLRRWLGA